MDEARASIDPDDRYPADGLREVERHALEVLELLPGATLERTRDIIQLDWLGEQGIVVLVTAEAVELRLPTVEWTMGAYGPARTSRLWKRRVWSRLNEGELAALVAAAQQERRKEYRTCRYCGRAVPPEHRHGANLCQSCASKHLGVTY